MCHPAWQKGFADGIKLRIVDGEITLGYLGGLNAIPRVPEIGREVGREPEMVLEGLSLLPLAVRTAEEPISQGVQAASRFLQP